MPTIQGCTVQTAVEEATTLGAEHTSGSYQALAGMFPAGHPAPPLHVHPDTDELFYIGGGEATFTLVDEEVRVTAGGFVLVPRGTAHTVRNSGDGVVHGLILISPGDAEHRFVPVEG